MVGMGQQVHDCAFSRVHALCHCHTPRGIYDKQNQIGGALNTYFALQVLFFDGVGHVLVATALLERCGSAEGCIKGDVIAALSGWLGTDVASPLAIRERLATPTRCLTR